jgi:hypothetical protein
MIKEINAPYERLERCEKHELSLDDAKPKLEVLRVHPMAAR